MKLLDRGRRIGLGACPAERACSFMSLLSIAVACGVPPDTDAAYDTDTAADVDAAEVEVCLSEALGTEGWSELPLSETGKVYGVDFGPNSVLVYIEPDATEVREKIQSIREAEENVGNTATGDRVILRDRGNVLVSWANPPTADQRAPVEACVGFS